MKTKRLVPIIGLLAALLFSQGCFLTPKTAALQHVHTVYGEDYATSETLLPAQPGLAGKAARASGSAFAKSLDAIQTYRSEFPQNTQELAHLKVLEGMIYLQSGRFGLAESVRPDIEASVETLGSGTGRAVRDQLFAQNFGLLINGWRETQKPNNRSWRTFEEIADELTKRLSDIPDDKLALKEADGGALYLANSAAVFYVWAYAEITSSPEYQQAKTKKAEWFPKARDIIGRFLTESEKAADISGDFGDGVTESVTTGRLRHVRWYHWLAANCASTR